VLGQLLVTRDRVPVDLPGRRPRALLAVLLKHRGQPLTVEQLVEGLWGEQAPASATAALHVHLSKLRNVVGELLLRTPAGYVLQQGRYTLDADRFDALLATAQSDPATAAGQLREALALWRGEPLAEFPAEGPLGEWRRTLGEQHLQATILRIDADLAGGAAGELVAELERLVAAQPFEERLWEQLILALYRAGRQADALDAYTRARNVLVAELGLEPGRGLQSLHARILRQDETLSLPSGENSSAPARPVNDRSALPQPTTRLIGRTIELLELQNLIDDPFCRLVTLTGPGGVGKTRLAIAHARRWAESFSDGAVFVGLARLTDAKQVRGEIASALARRENATEPNEHSLGRFLRSRELLLVLDNFEHVLGAADVVAELLEDAPGLKVLATSRERLRLRGEHRFDVDPLSTEAGEGQQAPAVQLFIQGAKAIDRRFPTDEETLLAIAEICRALDGLPLAIELAAARTSALSVEQIAGQLAAPLTIGSGALRGLPQRHRTLEATIRWSYELLPAQTQRVLRVAASFHGAFTPQALAAGLGAPLDGALDALVEASLVHPAAIPGRFRLLELVRAFGRERLAEAGEANAVQRALRQFYAEHYREVAADEFPTEPGPTARRMAPDHADLRAAIASAVADRDAGQALTLTRAMQPIWMTGQLEESGTIVDHVLEAFDYPPDDEMYLLRMAAFANSYRPSNTYWSMRRVTRAGELGQVGPQVAGLGNLIAQALARRDFAEALSLRDQLLPLVDSPQLRRRTRASGVWILAGCAYCEGQLDEACRLADEAVADAASDGHPHMLTIARTMRLEVGSARDRTIELGALKEIVDGAVTLQIADVSYATLVCAGRYAVNFDRTLAAELIAYAERLNASALGGDMWPEAQLRDEVLQLLGYSDSAALLEHVPTDDATDILARLQRWLAARPSGERGDRSVQVPVAIG
jgi:predicted ATPase/DNA-binding SARP family transcriptional activator